MKLNSFEFMIPYDDNHHRNISIVHDGNGINCAKIITDHKDVLCVIFLKIDGLHEDNVFSNPAILRLSFTQFLMSINYRKFNFFFQISEKLQTVLSEILLDRGYQLTGTHYFMARTSPVFLEKNTVPPTIEFKYFVEKHQLVEVKKLLKLNAYWQRYLTIDALDLLLQTSQCFIAIQNHEVIAFARVLTDGDMFGSIWDVVVDKKYQGAGVCSILMNEIFSYPAFSKIKKWILFTETAGNLYAKFGFQPINAEGQVFYNPVLSRYVVFL